jgi:hypothetical protein
MTKPEVLAHLERVEARPRVHGDGLNYFLDGVPCTTQINSLIIEGLVRRSGPGHALQRVDSARMTKIPQTASRVAV